MRLAFGVAYNLASDPVAARMAFKECYVKQVAEARATSTPPTWSASFGYDVAGREDAQLQAIKINQLTQQSLKLLAKSDDEVVVA